MEWLTPDKLWSREEVLQKPSPVPREGGVYAWFFRMTPPRVPTEDCHEVRGLKLLYVGISPKAPPRNGASPSKQTLRSRVSHHYRGNAEGSTLRLTLGCLLEDELGIQLRRVGSGKRMTFAGGEERLSEWLQENAFLTWLVHEEPSSLENQLISELSLPLNLAGNQAHPFHSSLSGVRAEAKRRARELPILEG